MYFIMKYTFPNLYQQINAKFWPVEEIYEGQEKHIPGFGKETRRK